MTEDELYQLTSYKVASKQLRELHRAGFARARRSAVTGRVILERAHYLAVCGGQIEKPRPKLRTVGPQLRLDKQKD